MVNYLVFCWFVGSAARKAKLSLTECKKAFNLYKLASEKLADADVERMLQALK